MPYKCMKFHGNTSNGFQVIEQKQFCDGQIDRRMAKNNVSPNLPGGHIISNRKHQQKRFLDFFHLAVKRLRKKNAVFTRKNPQS